MFPIIVNGPNDFAAFADTHTVGISHAAIAELGPEGAVLAKFHDSKYGQKVAKLVDTFGFELRDLGVASVNTSRTVMQGTVSFRIVGEGKFLKEMLESLMSRFLNGVMQVVHTGGSIELTPAEE